MLKSSKYIVSGVLVAAVLGLAVYYRHDVLTALADMQITWAAAGFVCILFNYFFRALRLNLLTGNRLAVWPQGIYCTGMHGFANYMLPLRSGDLALPFLLKSLSDMDLKTGATILYKARLLEVFTLGIWLAGVSLIPFSRLPSSVTIAMGATGALMVLSPFLLRRFFDSSILPFDVVRRAAKILAQTSRMNLREILLTCAIWASIAAGVWCVAAAIRLPIAATDIVLLIALQLAMQFIPVQGFANSGNHEGGWVAALVLMGFPAGEALKFALSSHAVILIYVLLVGLIALAMRHTSLPG